MFRGHHLQIEPWPALADFEPEPFTLFLMLCPLTKAGLDRLERVSQTGVLDWVVIDLTKQSGTLLREHHPAH